MRRVEICDEQGAVLETVNIDDSSPHWKDEVLERFNERGTAVIDLETNTVPGEVLEADTKARESAARDAKAKGASVRPVDSSGTYPETTPVTQAPRFTVEDQEFLAHATRSSGLRANALAEESHKIFQERQAQIDAEANKAAARPSRDRENERQQAEGRKVTTQSK